MRLWMARAVCLLVLVSAGQAARPMKWESLKLVKAAAEKGDHEAQFLLGVQYRAGDGLPRDRVEAAKWLRKAAESGHAEAQYALGDLYADAEIEDGLADPAEAMKWLQAAAGQGQPEAKARLEALRTQPNSDAGGADTAAKTAAAKGSGDPTAGAGPGQVPDKSREMDEDPAETVRWSLLLSGLRGAEALLLRGFMLENGVVVNRDLPAAAESYRKAANLGDARAACLLGKMYVDGRGVAKDAAEADRWLNQAASSGSAEAVTVLARLNPASSKKAAGPGEKMPAQERPQPAKKP